MQEEKRWELLPLCAFLALVAMSVALGNLISALYAARISENLDVGKEFVIHVISFVTLHAFALVWTTVFLNQHEVSWRQGFGFGKRPVSSMALGLGTMVIAFPVATLGIGTLVAWLVKAFGLSLDPQRTVTLVRDTSSTSQVVVLGIAAVALAPVVEEIIFRGVLFKALYQRGYKAAAWIGTSFMFAAIHGNRAAFFPLMFLALVFAWLYVRTGNLLAPIAGHAVFNALNFWLITAPPKWTWLQKLLNQ